MGCSASYHFNLTIYNWYISRSVHEDITHLGVSFVLMKCLWVDSWMRSGHQEKQDMI